MPLPTPTTKEQYHLRTYTEAEDGTQNGKRVYRVEYPEAFEACTNSEKDAVTSHVRAAVGISRYAAFPGEPLCLCQTVDVSNDGSHRVWLATYGYSSKFDGATGDGGAAAAEMTGAGDGFDVAASPSPSAGDRATEAESRPFTIRSIKRTVQEVLEYDQETGRRITNSAGDPFDPPLMREVTCLGYEITFYKYRANLRWKAPVSNPPLGRPDYLDSVNNAVFKIFDRPHGIGTLRVSDVSKNMIWDKGTSGALFPVFELRVELLHKPGGWKRNVLDQGMREKVGTDLRRIMIKGVEVTEPVMLNGSGAVLTPGNALQYITAWEYPKLNLIELFQ